MSHYCHCMTNHAKLSGIKQPFYYSHEFCGSGIQTRNVGLSRLCSPMSGPDLGRLKHLGQLSDGLDCLVTSSCSCLVPGLGWLKAQFTGAVEQSTYVWPLHAAGDSSQPGDFKVAKLLSRLLGLKKWEFPLSIGKDVDKLKLWYVANRSGT